MKRAARGPSVAGPAPRFEVRPSHTADIILPPPRPGRCFRTTERVVVIGASTGGTEAIRAVLLGLRRDCPGVVITQHIPPIFSRAFAERLDHECAMTVREACHDEPVLPGHVYVAPGDRHLLLRRDGAAYRLALDDGPPVNRHRPSVDVLFRSAAEAAGPNAVGLVLTGMGADGAEGLAEMRAAGARTIAQDEASSVVWGMPKAAVSRGAVQDVLPLARIAAALNERLGVKA